MYDFAAIFVQRYLESIVKQTIQAMTDTTPEPSYQANRRDAFAQTEISAAKNILVTAQSNLSANEIAETYAYIEQVTSHLERALSWGIPQVFAEPLDSASIAILEEMAPKLSPNTIKAETYLGATAWAMGQEQLAIQYLVSAAIKAEAVSKVRTSQAVQVHEEITIAVTAEPSYKVTWAYSGIRPVVGSPARLAQDIEFAKMVAQGENPTPMKIYGKWAKSVVANQHKQSGRK